MQKVAQRPKGNNVLSQVEMVLVEADGHTRSRKMRVYSREDSIKKQRILLFLHPPGIADTALLIEDYKEDDALDSQWIYLPALHKSKRIGREKSSGSFMGSDFSYGDLITRTSEDFSYRVIQDSEVQGAPVYVVEALPKTTQVMKECGYEKALFLVRKDNFVIVRSVLWVTGKSTLKYLDVQKLKQFDTIWVPMEIHARTVEDKKVVHQTILRVHDISFNNVFSDDLFTIQRLEQGW